MRHTVVCCTLFEMEAITRLLVFTFLTGCLATPDSIQESPQSPHSTQDDLSIFFYHSTPDVIPNLINGSLADPGAYPYMVALVIGAGFRDYVCGGSLISQRTVLTAAHCIEALHPNGTLDKTLRMVVGSNLWETGGTEYKFESNVTHPHYVASTVTNDLGLLITTTKVELTDVVKIVSLNYNYIEAGLPSIVTGWGMTKENGTDSESLLQIKVNTIDNQVCVDQVREVSQELKRHNTPPVEPKGEICTYHSAGLGTCNGDSGSPMVTSEGHTQIGIVSWGIPCARGAPDIFTRISAYQEFIESNIVH